MEEQEQLERVEQVFDEWASNGRADKMADGHHVAASDAFARLDVQAGQHYLDIGCGNGYTVRWAAQIDESVQACGLDLSEHMIRHARVLSADLPNTRFIHAPFPLELLKPRVFDAIFSMEVFYYLPDLTWSLLNVIRLLKPGGLFACVVDYYEENPDSHDWPDRLGVSMHRLSEEGWRLAMEAVGFDIVEQRRVCSELDSAEEQTWKHVAGSLLTLGRRPLDAA
jgi:SAM-dependent methyltransferase